MKTILLAGLTVLAAASSAAAANIEFPAPTRYPFQRSFLTHRAVLIPPYPYPFPIRVYTTPQQQPYYNVPPYAVVSPY